MAKQVQFYSVSKVTDATNSPNQNGIYFVNAASDHGIIYKGGIPYANKVFKVNESGMSTITPIVGDIVIPSTAGEFTQIYDGASWVQLIGTGNESSVAGTYHNGTSEVAGAITISAETSGGVVRHVSVALNTTDITLAGSGATLTNDMIPGAKSVVDYVDGKLSSFDNAMHFLGVGTVTKSIKAGTDTYIVTVNPPTDKTAKAGDIVIDSTTGLEAVCTAAGTWELIGDNAHYALNAYTSTAKVYTGVTTVPGALNAAGASIDAAFSALSTKASAGVSTSTSNSVTVSLSTYSNAAPKINVTTTLQSSITASSTNNQIPGAKAVWDLVSNFACAGGSSSATSNGVTVQVDIAARTAAPLVSVAVSPSMLGLGGSSTSTSNGFTVEVVNDNMAKPSVKVTAPAALSLGGSSSSTSKGVKVEVVNDSNAKPSVTTTVTLASKITTASTDTEIPSAKAVSEALCWYNAAGSIIA